MMTERSDYELSLFEKGILNVSDEEELVDKLLNFNPPEVIRPAGIDEYSTDDAIVEAQNLWYQMAWMHHFRGKVPVTWKDWNHVINDIGNASKLGVQLSPELLDAAVLYPDPEVALNTALRVLHRDGTVDRNTGFGQKLNSKQLAILRVRCKGGIGGLTLPDWYRIQVEQTKLGNFNTITQAKEIVLRSGSELLEHLNREDIPLIVCPLPKS